MCGNKGIRDYIPFCWLAKGGMYVIILLQYKDVYYEKVYLYSSAVWTYFYSS